MINQGFYVSYSSVLLFSISVQGYSLLQFLRAIFSLSPPLSLNTLRSAFQDLVVASLKAEFTFSPQLSITLLFVDEHLKSVFVDLYMLKKYI